MKNYQLWTETKDTPHFWGYHLMLDLSGINDNIKSKDKIKTFLKSLIKEIDMVAVGEPTIKYLLKNHPNAGYSAIQLIETSSITCHFMDHSRTAYIDVFSCKDFKPQDAISVVKEYFDPETIKPTFLTRDALKNDSSA